MENFETSMLCYWAAYFYFRTLDTVALPQVIAAPVLWGTLTVMFDLVGWVLVKHPRALTFRRFYICGLSAVDHLDLYYDICQPIYRVRVCLFPVKNILAKNRCICGGAHRSPALSFMILLDKRK